MKKAILVANRKGTDNNTNSNVLWLTMYELPREFKAKDGHIGLWYPKKDDAILIACIAQDIEKLNVVLTNISSVLLGYMKQDIVAILPKINTVDI